MYSIIQIRCSEIERPTRTGTTHHVHALSDVTGASVLLAFVLALADMKSANNLASSAAISCSARSRYLTVNSGGRISSNASSSTTNGTVTQVRSEITVKKESKLDLHPLIPPPNPLHYQRPPPNLRIARHGRQVAYVSSVALSLYLTCFRSNGFFWLR